MRYLKCLPLALLPILLAACSSARTPSAAYSPDDFSTQSPPAKTPDSAIIPYNALLTYPDDWPEIVRRRQEED